jgi:hypothetical protein
VQPAQGSALASSGWPLAISNIGSADPPPIAIAGHPGGSGKFGSVRWCTRSSWLLRFSYVRTRATPGGPMVDWRTAGIRRQGVRAFRVFDQPGGPLSALMAFEIV